MPLIEINDETKRLSLTCDEPANAENVLIRSIVDAAHVIHGKIPLQKVEVGRVPNKPNTYKYLIASEKGRQWVQKITMDITTDPEMTWDHKAKWRPSEFSRLAPLRKAIMDSIQGIKLHTLTITFN